MQWPSELIGSLLSFYNQYSFRTILVKNCALSGSESGNYSLVGFVQIQWNTTSTVTSLRKVTKPFLYVDFWYFDFKFYHHLHYNFKILTLKFNIQENKIFHKPMEINKMLNKEAIWLYAELLFFLFCIVDVWMSLLYLYEGSTSMAFP